MSKLDFKIKSLSQDDKSQLQKDYGAEKQENLIRALFTIDRSDLQWLSDANKEINKRVAFRRTSKSELIRLLIHEAKRKGVEKLIKKYTSNV
jgi:hypothetical protein